MRSASCWYCALKQGVRNRPLDRDSGGSVGGRLHQLFTAIGADEREICLADLGQHARCNLVEVGRLDNGCLVLSIPSCGQGER